MFLAHVTHKLSFWNVLFTLFALKTQPVVSVVRVNLTRELFDSGSPRDNLKLNKDVIVLLLYHLATKLIWLILLLQLKIFLKKNLRPCHVCCTY